MFSNHLFPVQLYPLSLFPRSTLPPPLPEIELLSNDLLFTETLVADVIDHVFIHQTLAFNQNIRHNNVFYEILPITVGVARYKTVVLADLPISYWLLDETSGTTAVDYVDSNPGIYEGGYTLNQSGFGHSGSGVLFDGISGYINVPLAANLQLTGSFSLEAIVKLTNAPRNNAFSQLAGKQFTTGSTHVNYGLYAEGVNGTFHGEVVVDSTVVSVNGTTIPTAGTWYYVALTYDTNSLKIYVNGILENSTLINDNQAFTIGVSRGVIGDTGDFLPGIISNVAVYGHALLASQISSHYAAISKSPNTDLLIFTQNVTVTRDRIHSLRDSLNLTQNVVGVTSSLLDIHSPHITDTLTFTDHVLDTVSTHLVLLSPHLTDSLNLTQNVTGETSSLAGLHSLRITDTLTFTQNLVSEKGKFRKLHDTLTFTQKVVGGLVLSKHISQHLFIIDFPLSQIGKILHSLHDQLQLTDNVIWSYPPIYKESLSDTLIFTDSVNAPGSLHNTHLNDTLLFFETNYQRYIEGLIINVPTLIGTKIPGGSIIKGGGPRGGNYYDPNLNYNPNLPYVILQSSTSTVVLPAPLLGDTQTNVGTVIVNRAVDGTIYTIIKPTQRNRLKWKFDVKRQKSNEMQNFLQNNYLQYLTVVDFKGNVWYMRIVNNPISFEAVSRDGFCTLNNERHQFELELEGFLVSSQTLPC